MLDHKVLWITVLLSMPVFAFSQKYWSLDECIRYAWEHNIELQQEELKTTLQTYQVQKSKLQMLPDLAMRSSHTNRFGRSVDPLTYAFTTEDSRGASVSAYTTIDLFSGFQRVNENKKTRIDLDMQLARYDQAKQDLAMNITRHFLEILFYRELVTTIENQVKMTREQIIHTQKLVDAGARTHDALLEIQAQVANEEVLLTDARNQLEWSKLTLAQLLDIQNPANFNVAEPELSEELIQADIPEPDAIYQQSLGIMPALQAAQLQVKSAEKNLSIAKGSAAPSVSLTGGWGTGYSDQIIDAASGHVMSFRNQLTFSSTSYLSFSLNIPLFNGLSGYNRIREARLGIIHQQLQLEAEKNRLRKDIQLTTAEAHAAAKNYEAMVKSLESLNLAFEHTKRKFSLGMVTALEYTLAKNTLAKARSELLKAKYRYIFNTRLLNFYSASGHD